MNISAKTVWFLIAMLLTPVPAVIRTGGASAAEFDLDSGRVVLRRLQYCRNCGSALLVTHAHVGALVRCPDCGREQPRLANRLLLTQIYQICRQCLGPLDPKGRTPGDVIRCDTCHTPQALVRDAFAVGPDTEGLGYAPGFPPGSGKKILLHSPERPDGPITPIPIDDDPGEPDAPEREAVVAIPRPPPMAPPPLPELPPENRSSPSAPPPAEAGIAAATDEADPPGAVTVPAVTADLFGGRGRAAERADPGEVVSAGPVAAMVDGRPLYARDVDLVADPVIRRLRQNGAAEPDREKALRREVLERLIDRELAVREAAAIGHRPDPAAVRQREGELAQILAGAGVDIRREAERDVIMADMRRRYAEKPGSASPQAVRERYAAVKDTMIRPRLVAIDQLVVYEDRIGRADPRDCRSIAMEVSLALEQGRGFSELRERHDEFAAAAGVPHAEPALLPEAAYAGQILASAGSLRKGAVFGPLFMPGMALFGKVTDERPAGPIPFEEVEKDIRAMLENEATEKNLSAWLGRLRQKARVEILE